MLLRIDLDEGTFLADVGFGGHLFAAPLRLERDTEQITPASVLRLTGADQTLTLQVRLPAGWRDAYRFTLEPQNPADYVVANWFTSTHPDVLFRGNLLAERLTPEGRYSLFNCRLTQRRADGSVEERTLVGAEELANTLDEALAITPPANPADIWARLPKN